MIYVNEAKDQMLAPEDYQSHVYRNNPNYIGPAHHQQNMSGGQMHSMNTGAPSIQAWNGRYP